MVQWYHFRYVQRDIRFHTLFNVILFTKLETSIKTRKIIGGQVIFSFRPLIMITCDTVLQYEYNVSWLELFDC